MTAYARPPYPQGETVLLVRRGDRQAPDRYGNATFGPDIEVQVPGCAVAPAATSEPLEVGRRSVQVDLTVYLPPGTVVGPHDRIKVRDVLYDVIGEPGNWHNPYTGTHAGLEAGLRRIDG